MTTAQESLILKQSEHFELIKGAIKNLNASETNKSSKAQLQTRLDMLESNWKHFQSGHGKLSAGRAGETLKAAPYFTTNLYAQCEEEYVNARAFMLTLLDALILPASNLEYSQDEGTHKSHLRSLPKISLTKFSGEYSMWRPFRDLFNSMIRSNNELSSVEKFYYLRTSLTGEAAQLIANIPASSENFTQAWEIISTRYENKRVLVDSHIETIFQLKVMTKKSASELKYLLAAIKESVGSLKALGVPVQHWDILIVFITVQRLDRSTHEAWELHRGSSTEPATFQELEEFLNGRIRALESVEARNATASTKPHIHDNPSASKHKTGFKAHISSIKPHDISNKFVQPFRTNTCYLCSADHYIAKCPSYQSKSPEQRHAVIIEKKLCFNCLGLHRISACRSPKRCQHCGQNHHSSIHLTQRSTPGATISGTQQTEIPQAQCDTFNQDNVISNHASSTTRRSPQGPLRVLLATALVRLRSPNGTELKARALLDQGSEISFISESLTQRLHLHRQHATLPIIGIGANRSCSTNGLVFFKLLPHFDSQFECNVTAYVLPKLTAQLPSTNVPSMDWPHLRNLKLADPDFAKPGKIDLVLGADLYCYLLEADILKGDTSEPVAQRTSLGWIISGIFHTKPTQHRIVQGFQCCVDHNLHKELQRFWIQEEGHSTSATSLTKEEMECESHFVSSHTRDSTGRYTVRLPFKLDPEQLGESKTIALQMLHRMQIKFSTNPEFHALYSSFLQEYENLTHMIKSTREENTHNQEYYLPHHGVLRDSSSTTKLRVVFNGSCRTSNGLSLNDVLHVGPKLQLDLSDVLTWWRQHFYVFSADIEKMFRQIRVHPEDWRYQKIVWSPSTSSKEATTYLLTTVTYGLAPAPFLANRVLRQLAIDEGQQNPLAVNIIHHSTYVDDTFGGADSLEEAQQAVKQLDALCTAGGFNLQKWTANDSGILSNITPKRQSQSDQRSIKDSQPIRTLGISWYPNSDAFTFISPVANYHLPFTKRKVLSCIAKLFDPLGWISPVTIRAKIFMQGLWLCKANWDEPLSAQFEEEWNKFIFDIQEISQISIPRWIGTSSKMLGIEIHGFADASEHAMGAVLYLRVINDFHQVTINILEAKTKVAPLKRTTIPRLELNAALILSRRAAHIRNVLNLHKAPMYLWTDSSVALTWIKGDSNRWRDYVNNRVSQIHEIVPSARWRHVPGKENPADCASRGITTSQLLNHSLWWQGPNWLSLHSSSWPTTTFSIDIGTNLEERFKMANHVQSGPNIWELINRYSKLNRLLRVTAVCRRVFAKESRSLFQKPLTPAEIEHERCFWVKITQWSYFESEIKLLSRSSCLSNSNSLSKFLPFIDANGLMRVGGRLRNTILDPEAKHPLLLPRESALTTLIIADAHTKTLHGGTQIMLAYLRQAYWIMGGRLPVKSYVLRCVRCARQRGITAKQIMGQLPVKRINPSRPFLHSGVDYAGPLQIKTWKGRGAKTYKGYIVLFVCLVTSALHLELVTDYTVEGFLAAYKRFTARRGICSTLTSDCGTNLIGASSELKRLFSKTSNELRELRSLLANDGTEWHFNPPAAPHFGGKWEAGVKSVKFHLRRIIGDTSLTFEELNTLLTQIEGILNSRPLCPISDDPTDVNALTPGHFLIGSPLSTLPEPSLLDLRVSTLSRWQLIRQMVDNFWNRWSKEYLQRFHAVSKWKQQTESIRPGQIVLINDERYPPSKWPLGRVVEVHPGTDGLVRVATIRTKTTTLKRPVVKLCPLPVEVHSPILH